MQVSVLCLIQQESDKNIPHLLSYFAFYYVRLCSNPGKKTFFPRDRGETFFIIIYSGHFSGHAA